MDKREGKYQDFPSKFFVAQCRNISLTNPSMLCFRKSLVTKRFLGKREGEVS